MASVLGLTGGIATGKSTAVAYFSTLGAAIIDADAIVHELQAPGQPLLEEIAAEFGAAILDAAGALDRTALGAIVFRDPKARARLDKIVHPKVQAAMAERLTQLQDSDVPLIVLDIPLLFEKKSHPAGDSSSLPFDAIVVIYAPKNTQLERQMKRDGCDRDEALRRIRAQLPIDEKKDMADFVIDNTGSLQETEQQIEALYRRFTSAVD
jgi:dephospho-CoA kinase